MITGYPIHGGVKKKLRQNVACAQSSLCTNCRFVATTIILVITVLFLRGHKRVISGSSGQFVGLPQHHDYMCTTYT